MKMIGQSCQRRCVSATQREGAIFFFFDSFMRAPCIYLPCAGRGMILSVSETEVLMHGVR